MKKKAQPAWLGAAIDYVPQWLAFQLERYRLPGVAIAIAKGPQLVAELALGVADMRTGKPLTPRHRFRIASHSKSFTAAGVLLLREQGKLGLDDPVGRYVAGLHKDLAGARVGELLSHGGGVIRDGFDSGQWLDRRPFLSAQELRADLARKQPLEPGMQLKYSNHGYGLLGLMIEEVTGSGYSDWMMRNVVQAAGLRETVPDMPLVKKGAPVAMGHSTEHPFGQRLIIPGDNACNAIAPGAGFVSTASDVARFFAQLAPDSKESILTPASRRDMMHRRWRDECSMQESYYGFGTMINARGPKEWHGHTGSLQGFVSRTSRFSSSGFTITVLANSTDAFAYDWVDGIAGILNAFERHGAPGRKHAAWNGRWWSMWGASDLVPMGKVVCHTMPGLPVPFNDATTELSISDRERGTITRTSGYNSPGQPVRMVRDGRGKARELWMGGTRLVTRQAMVDEALGRYRKSGHTRIAA